MKFNKRIMEVIILAGGLGTRLRSAIGNEIPKCMAPVAGKPFLWYLLKYLARYSVNKVVFSVGYLRHVIINWIDEAGGEFPFSFDYAIEEKPLGTGGGIKSAMRKCVTTDVAVLNGDTFFDVNLDDFYSNHHLYTAAVSLALKPMTNFERYGRVRIDNVGHLIQEFCEKKPCKEGLINGGVYLINRDNVQWPEEEKFSFETEVLETSVKKGRLYGFDFGGYFIDIGIPADYAKAQEDFKRLF